MIVRVLRFAVLSFALLTILAAFSPALQAQEADLLVEKSGPAEAAADTDVAYTVTVTNLGPDDAANVTLNDNIPAGMTFVSESQDSGPTFICTTPAVGAGGAITCTNALMAAGSSASFTFTVHIDAGTPDGVSFNNIVTVSTTTFDPNSENDAATVVTTTPPPPEGDVFVQKDGPSGAASNTDVTYTLTVGNAGPDAAENLTLTDTLPGTMVFVSLTQNSGPTLICTTPASGSGGTISCSAATFAGGATATFTLVTHIPAGTPSGTSFTNTVNVESSNDPEESNNSSTTTLIVSSVDVGVAKNGAATATAGTNISYTLTVTNAGPDTATNVSLIDTLPAGTTFVSFTADSGAAVSATCGTPIVGFPGTVSCVFNVLASGATGQFTLTIHIGNTTSITNTATVDTDAFDTNPANDSDSVTTTVTPSADLAVTKSGPSAVVAGENATYTIDVTNAGPSTATTVSLSDTLPAGTTFVSLSSPAGWSCTTPAVGAAGTVTCTAATFAPGPTASFTLTVNVAASVAPASTIANTATVTAATGDPNSGNNSSTSGAATVSASADLNVTKTGPGAVSPGTDISYTITVTNAGPSDAAAVSLSDTLPANTTFVSVTQTTGPTFACTTPPVGGTGTLTCTIATLNAAASATFSLVLHVDPATPVGSTIGNTATISSTTPDPNGANGSSASNAAVAAGVADVRIEKTANQSQLATGANATYTITVTNDGPAIAIDTVVTDTLPAGTTFQSATPSQGTCSGTTTVTCSLGNLNAGASATITLMVTLPSTPGPVENTATVTSTNVDSNPANNTSSTTIAVSSAQAIPTLSEWMLLLLAMALGVVAVGTRLR